MDLVEEEEEEVVVERIESNSNNSNNSNDLIRQLKNVPDQVIDGYRVVAAEVFERGNRVMPPPEYRSKSSEEALAKMREQSYLVNEKKREEGYHEWLPESKALSQCFCSETRGACQPTWHSKKGPQFCNRFHARREEIASDPALSRRASVRDPVASS